MAELSGLLICVVMFAPHACTGKGFPRARKSLSFNAREKERNARNPRNDKRKLLFPHLHFTRSVTLLPRLYNGGRTSAAANDREKAPLANYACNNSPAHQSRHRNWWKCSVEFLSVCRRRRTATSSPFTKLLSRMWNCPVTRDVSEKKFPPFRNDPRQLHCGRVSAK